MNKANLANQVISIIVLSNSESDSTGLYKCRCNLIPSIYLSHIDIPYIIKDGYILLQDLQMDIEPKYWTRMALTWTIRFIMVGNMSKEVADVLQIIANHIDVVVNLRKRTIRLRL